MEKEYKKPDNLASKLGSVLTEKAFIYEKK